MASAQTSQVWVSSQVIGTMAPQNSAPSSRAPEATSGWFVFTAGSGGRWRFQAQHLVTDGGAVRIDVRLLDRHACRYHRFRRETEIEDRVAQGFLQVPVLLPD